VIAELAARAGVVKVRQQNRLLAGRCDSRTGCSCGSCKSVIAELAARCKVRQQNWLIVTNIGT
jgi:hypothetical protein